MKIPERLMRNPSVARALEFSRRPVVRRVGNVAYWAFIALLAFVAYRRFAPLVELADLGPAPQIDMQFLGLSTDDAIDEVRAFAAERDFNYPLLVGPNRAGSGYQVPVLPTTFLVDRDGRIRFRHEGLLLAHALRPALRALVRE